MSGTEFIIRNAVPEDGDAVIALQENLFPNDPIALEKNEFDENSNSQTQIFVAYQNNQLAGFVVLRNRRFRPWAGGDFLGVSPLSRLSGIAKKLVEAALLNSNRPLVRLFVRPSNLQAMQIYKSFGFRKISIRRQNYPDGEDALVMMRLKKFDFLR